MAALACLCGTNAFSDEAGLAPGRAAGAAAAGAPIADMPLMPGKAAGVHEAQNIGQTPLLVIGLGGLVVAGAVLALSGGGGGGGAAVTPMQNMLAISTTSSTAP